MRYNLFIHPGDTIYLPSNKAETIQVARAVREPGTQAYTSDMHLSAVLARRGGFQENAWRQRILVVRGNLAAPTVHAVNFSDIIAGKTRDFMLRPGDLVHVADRPYEDIRLWTRTMLRRCGNSWLAIWSRPG